MPERCIPYSVSSKAFQSESSRNYQRLMEQLKSVDSVTICLDEEHLLLLGLLVNELADVLESFQCRGEHGPH